MLPAPTVDDLATFSGRPVDSYTAYADQALAQATLLFSILTKREEYPDDPAGLQLATNAITELADVIYLGQRYREVKASPYQSETIGSYSYSKIVNTAQSGLKTGLSWWDLAVRELSLAQRSLVTSGSVSAMEHDHVEPDPCTGQLRVVGPADGLLPDLPFDVNAETYPRDPSR